MTREIDRYVREYEVIIRMMPGTDKATEARLMDMAAQLRDKAERIGYDIRSAVTARGLVAYCVMRTRTI